MRDQRKTLGKIAHRPVVLKCISFRWIWSLTGCSLSTTRLREEAVFPVVMGTSGIRKDLPVVISVGLGVAA